MADDLRKPIIIDFFGLPGCGKSTVSHILAEELRKQGKVVSEPSYDTDHKLSPMKRRLFKICQFTAYACTHPVKTLRVVKIIKGCGNSVISSISLSMITIVRTSEINKCEDENIVLDQGCTQLAISICQNARNINKLQEAYDLILRLIGNTKIVKSVYISLGIETALERQDQRGTLVSRVDRETNQERKKEILQYFEDACNYFKDRCHVEVDGEDEALEMVKQLRVSLSKSIARAI